MELWLTQLPFAFQFALVIVVLAPVCLGVAWVIDRAVEWISTRVSEPREHRQPVGAPSSPDTSPPSSASPIRKLGR